MPFSIELLKQFLEDMDAYSNVSAYMDRCIVYISVGLSFGEVR